MARMQTALLCCVAASLLAGAYAGFSYCGDGGYTRCTDTGDWWNCHDDFKAVKCNPPPPGCWGRPMTECEDKDFPMQRCPPYKDCFEDQHAYWCDRDDKGYVWCDDCQCMKQCPTADKDKCRHFDGCFFDICEILEEIAECVAEESLEVVSTVVGGVGAIAGALTGKRLS